MTLEEENAMQGRIGFNTGVLDVLSVLFTTQALLIGVEPKAYAELLDNQLRLIEKQGGHPVYLATRKMPSEVLRDQLAGMTLEMLRSNMRRVPQLHLILGGKDSGGSVPGGAPNSSSQSTQEADCQSPDTSLPNGG